jgi:ubiquitin carboxyl-terminal hydrolase 25
VYKVASFCQQCRCHMDLIVDFRGHRVCQNPCPNANFPLHHFILDEEDFASGSVSDDGISSPDNLEFSFRCTSELCRAGVTVRIRPPRLKRKHLNLLTNTQLLEARREDAIRQDPERLAPTDFPSATPTEALEVFYSYLRDSLEKGRPPSKRRVPVLNRRYMAIFGQDCEGFLEEFGFKHGASVRDELEYPHRSGLTRLRQTKTMMAQSFATCQIPPRSRIRLPQPLFRPALRILRKSC